MSEMLTRLIFYRRFSRLLYDFFLTLTSKALRLFYLLDNDCNTCRSHPASTPLHDTFYVKISVTFECDCPFLLQVDVAGDGSTHQMQTVI
jgi:hypothetical protein